MCGRSVDDGREAGVGEVYKNMTRLPSTHYQSMSSHYRSSLGTARFEPVTICITALMSTTGTLTPYGHIVQIVTLCIQGVLDAAAT
jgi:hypothetical protein